MLLLLLVLLVLLVSVEKRRVVSRVGLYHLEGVDFWGCCTVGGRVSVGVESVGGSGLVK